MNAIPESLASATRVLTANDFEIDFQDEFLSQSAVNVKEVETFSTMHKELNPSTLKAAKMLAAGAVVAGGVIGAAALATASLAAMAATSTASAIAADPAIIVDNRWCLSAWVPSELNGE